ncbi:MAG: hypothetical protein WDO13_14725 [Verrucomicrobiota bacterium]
MFAPPTLLFFFFRRGTSVRLMVAVPAGFHDTLSIMKVATVADLRNKFAQVSRWIEDGEKVEIRKRGKVFAVLTPPSTQKRPKKKAGVAGFEGAAQEALSQGSPRPASQ